MDKLQMIYSLANALGIKHGSTGWVVTPPLTTYALILIVEAIAATPGLINLQLLCPLYLWKIDHNLLLLR